MRSICRYLEPAHCIGHRQATTDLGVVNWCGRPDSNRHRPCGPTDFRTTSAFAAAIWRLWSGLSLHPGFGSCRCCPSSLYTFLSGERLGSGLPVKVSPTLSSSAPWVSPRALNGLSPMRLPVSPRPHAAIYTTHLTVGKGISHYFAHGLSSHPLPISSYSRAYVSSPRRTACTSFLAGTVRRTLMAEASNVFLRWDA
jgi:hypothetical protein